MNFPGDGSFNGKEGIDNTNGHIHNVPAVEAGYWGNNLGVMDLELEKQSDGKWNVTSSKAANRPIFKTVDGKKSVQVSGPDQEIVDIVKDAHEGTLSYVRGKIGTTTAPMYSYFARVQDDPTIQIVNNAQKAYVKNGLKKTSLNIKMYLSFQLVLHSKLDAKVRLTIQIFLLEIFPLRVQTIFTYIKYPKSGRNNGCTSKRMVRNVCRTIQSNRS